MAHVSDFPKPRYKVFFELIAETQKALRDLRIIIIKERGIGAVHKYLKTNRIKLAHGSIRFDRDRAGTVFIQEFRPSPSIFQRGEFYSIEAEKPFWEIAGTAIVRLARRRERLNKDKMLNITDFFFIGLI